MSELEKIIVNKDCALYRIPDQEKSEITKVISSTPETRAICNDPLICGCVYTDSLRTACTKILQTLSQHALLSVNESQALVLNILRGGLNFGLREALATAFGWNSHASAFVSAQRARNSDNSEDWHITESSYQKIYLPEDVQIIFGDVVATGTSLKFALKEIVSHVEKNNSQVASLTFFTFGSEQSELILAEVDQICRSKFKNYQGATIIYLEGRFAMATNESKLSVKITGTDLIRCNALLAPEFIQSQAENPLYPIERCTIYDAGSRAFWLPEYFADLTEYWEATETLATSGMTYQELLTERFPELLQDKQFIRSQTERPLSELCRDQLERIKAIAS